MRVGPEVEDIASGDSVLFMVPIGHPSCFRTRSRVDQSLVVKIPEDLSFGGAAGLPFNYATAIYGLEDVAKLCGNDTILIHDGASALGQAAIQYSQMTGAETYTTVSTVEDREFLMSEYGIPDDHIFSHRDLSFAKGIMRSTRGAGANVIFNTLTGEARQESLACIAPFGVFIEISKKNVRTDNLVDLSPLQQNVTLLSVDMDLMIRHRPILVRRLITRALELYADCKIDQIRPFTVMGFTQIKEGIQALQGEEHVGKIVFVPDPSNVVPVAPDVIAPFQFDSEASYVLAGGLGGLGRSLARWMASRGAKNLIFLSRSGRITESVQEMITQLKEIGCSVHIFTCDVANADRLRAVIEACSGSLPPIKGCIQGSMVLQVSESKFIKFTLC